MPPQSRPRKCADTLSFMAALARANPERLVWGGDWPHPRMETEMPDVGHPFELFQRWTPDADLHPRHQPGHALRLRAAPSSTQEAQHKKKAGRP